MSEEIKALKSDIPPIFQYIVEKYNVERGNVFIQCDLEAIYIYEITHEEMDDDYNLLEIIEL